MMRAELRCTRSARYHVSRRGPVRWKKIKTKLGTVRIILFLYLPLQAHARNDLRRGRTRPSGMDKYRFRMASIENDRPYRRALIHPKRYFLKLI